MISKKCIHTNVHTLHRLHRLSKMSYFTAFLAKLDARKSDELTIKSLQEIYKVAGGGGSPPPMMFEEVMIQIGRDW